MSNSWIRWYNMSLCMLINFTFILHVSLKQSTRFIKSTMHIFFNTIYPFVQDPICFTMLTISQEDFLITPCIKFVQIIFFIIVDEIFAINSPFVSSASYLHWSIKIYMDQVKTLSCAYLVFCLERGSHMLLLYTSTTSFLPSLIHIPPVE